MFMKYVDEGFEITAFDSFSMTYTCEKENKQMKVVINSSFPYSITHIRELIEKDLVKILSLHFYER